MSTKHPIGNNRHATGDTDLDGEEKFWGWDVAICGSGLEITLQIPEKP